ncbi:hypothetical protein TNCV_4910721 [Trichonephila clavipes]|nr:hypothetical protein TNCV_4910721 [Trichonephila clavipes]
MKYFLTEWEGSSRLAIASESVRLLALKYYSNPVEEKESEVPRKKIFRGIITLVSKKKQSDWLTKEVGYLGTRRSGELTSSQERISV